MDSLETFEWKQLATRQKAYIYGAFAVLVLVLIGVGWDAWQAHSSVAQYEHDAAEANRQKDAALAQAAEIATQVKVREEELGKVEAKQNEKRGEVKSAGDDLARARSEYERSVHERLAGREVPSTDELCRQLAAACHPCQPR